MTRTTVLAGMATLVIPMNANNALAFVPIP